MAGSESRDGVSFAQWVGAVGEEDAEPVVGGVAEASSGALHGLDEQARRFDRAVRRAGPVVGEELGAPAPQRLRERSGPDSGSVHQAIA